MAGVRQEVSGKLAAMVIGAGLVLPAGSQAATATGIADLYQAQTITTGQMEEHRPAAFAQCFMDVLVKVSGDQRLLHDPQAAERANNAAAFVRAFRYRDRLEGKPIHDEQGTRDRPHDLTVIFDPLLIGGVLRSLGRAPWTAARPRLAAFLAVRFGAVSYILTQDEARGVNQREALDAAAIKIGLPVAVPSEADLADSGLSVDTLRAADPARLQAIGRRAGGDLVLLGSMVFSEEAQGWIAEWQLLRGEDRSRWQVKGVNYDEAFRNGLRGAAQILSNHGSPN